MRPLRVLGGILAALAAIVLLLVFGLASKQGTAGGRVAPALPREHIGGPPATLASLLASAGGRPSLVIFWASWCEPCAREAPALERFYRSARGRGRMVGVNWSDARSGARAFIRRYAWTFPNVRDPEGLVGNSYRLIGLPTTFVLDRGGHIRRVLSGPQEERSLAAALAAVERS